MTRRAHSRAITLEHRDIVALRAFARGYLHEDVLVEHGDAARAAAAYRAEAPTDESRQVADALDRLATAAMDKPKLSLGRFFASDLGCAWMPDSLEDVRALAKIIRRGLARPAS
jgi:hypothetical protein